MDYIEGEELQTMAGRRGPLSEKMALAWVGQVLDALEYVHRQQQQPPVIHRDVKPGNIKIMPQGKAVLVDFGIAKAYVPGQFNYPEGVAVDAKGNVCVVDTYNYRIQVFNFNSDFIAKWGSVGNGDGEFNYPRGVAVDAKGNVYVADSGNHRIQKFPGGQWPVVVLLTGISLSGRRLTK